MATYSESKRTGTGTGRSQRRAGRLRTAYGACVVAMLVLASILASRSSDALEDPSQSLHPPHSRFLQSFLYDPLGECTFQPLFRFGGDDNRGEYALSISSRPGLTAVVGREYTYRPTVIAGSRRKDTPDLAAADAPSGFELSESGVQFTWTPLETGRFCVTISADAGSTRVYQTFEMFVSDKPHWFGTDRAGRDVLWALAAGARWALLPGLIMALLAVGLGTLIGGLGGYYGGAINDVFEFVTSVTESIPGLLLLFLVAVLSDFNVYLTIAALGLLWMPRTARAVRARVIQLKSHDFVEACRELGQSDSDILWREIVWSNERNQLLSQFFQALSFAIVIEVTISYLGLGVKLPEISWGVILKEGRDAAIAANVYWIVAVTSVAVLVAVHGLNSLGRGLSELLGRETR